MAKTLKQFRQGYTPRSADEKKFVDKHTVNKVEDANGNKDDVFQATNITAYDRELEHGYNPGSDEEVYEEASRGGTITHSDVAEDVEQIDEAFPAVLGAAGRLLASGARKAGRWAGRAAIETGKNLGTTVGTRFAQNMLGDTVGSAVASGVSSSDRKKALAAEKQRKTRTAEEEKAREREAYLKALEARVKELEAAKSPSPLVTSYAPPVTPAPLVTEAKDVDVPFEGPYVKKPDAHGPQSRARHLAKMAMQAALDAAGNVARKSKKKVNEDELKNYLLSLYEGQLTEEENAILQEMLETDEGTKVAFMVSMLVNDEQALEEAVRKNQKYSHTGFLRQLKSNGGV